MRLKYLIILIVFVASCGPQHIRDPNAHVLVTSQYENEAPRIIINNSNCRPQLDCTGITESECAISLYYDSTKFIQNGQELIKKELYLSASLEFMQAMCRLIESEIRAGRSKTINYENYKKVIEFDLEKKVKEKIKFCERMISFTQWKRK
jgi:hypothetical protein